MKKDLKFFLGPQEIAGLMLKLKHSLDDVGIKNEFFCLWEYKYAGKDTCEYQNKRLTGYFYFVKKSRKNLDAGRIKQARFWQLFEMVSILKCFVHSLFHYNVFVYMYALGLFAGNYYLKKIPELEFKILHLFKKRIIIWCVGSDSRATYCDGFFPDITEERLVELTRSHQKNIRMLEKYATIIDMTASAHNHRKPYIHYTAIGNMADHISFPKKKNDSDKVVIIHAPTNPGAKGTANIRKIIKNIEAKGYSIEYRELMGLPHDELLKELEKADIVMDQMFSDYPMSLLAVDASSLGVPVVVGGYYAEFYKQTFPKPIPPVFYVEPDSVEQCLIELIGDRSLREKKGNEAREFLINNWSPEMVLKRFIMIAEGTIPEEWYCNPTESEFVWGAGCYKEEVIRRTKLLVEKYGMDILGLDKNSRLYKAYEYMLNNTSTN